MSKLFYKKIVFPIVCILVITVGLSYHIVHSHPIWKYREIDFRTKLQVAISPAYVDFIDAYILRPDKQTKFDVVVIDTGFTHSTYRHVISEHGKFVSDCVLPHNTCNKSCHIMVTTLINTQRIHCWVIESIPEEDYFLWRLPDAKQYHSLYCNTVEKFDLQELREPVKTLYTSGRWKWFLLFSDYLLSAGNSDLYPQVNRYAAGRFTARELAINRSSGISNTQVQRFALQMKTKYNF